MKIVHVGFGGGITTVIQGLATGLSAHSHQAILFGPTTTQTTPPQILGAETSVILWRGNWNIFGYLTGMIRLFQQLRHTKADLVFLHGFVPAVFGAWPASLAGIKKRVMIDHAPQLTYRLLKKLFFYLPSKRITSCISVSSSAHQWFLRQFSYFPKRLTTVIENGIDVDRFRTVKGRELMVQPFVISMISRLDAPQKDPITLIKALAILRYRHKAVHLVLAGTGNLVPEIEKTIAKLNLHDVVSLPGFISDITTCFEETDIVALSTKWEGMPMGILEAMAAGLPIVASDVVGVQGVIEDGSNGILVPPQNPEALANAIETMVANPELTREFGHRARTTANQRFQYQAMLERYSTFLNALET